MKTIFALAAVVAALPNASNASAHGTVGGHWEWRTQPSFGPKSTVPSRTRVWVEDSGSEMANCDCAMMKTDASGCMMAISRKSPSAG